MKIEIKKWTNDEVLFSLDIENNSIKLTVEAAVKAGVSLSYANLYSANLVRANLDSANLYSANLDSANLNGAKYGDFTIKKLPIQISNIGYYVLIFETHMKIGCELHTHDEWKNFTNREIAEMDGKKALAFWKQYKSLLVGFCKTMEEKKIKKKESNNE
ncbi:MAG TPA: hypothetical protein DCZ94_21690 [Lentisphaeria bacterium]|nr:hypothetical protein [Lentisphaeria bacterium]